MPRVNRDLQRRMAARRERERRRPSGERRYRFASAEPALEPDDTTALDNAVDTEAEVVDETPAATRRRGSRDGAPSAERRATGAPRVAAKPFSAYGDEYAYVYGDLRRVGLVIGSLLVILVVLSFVLPLLVH